jgi:hypothetical protein
VVGIRYRIADYHTARLLPLTAVPFECAAGGHAERSGLGVAIRSKAGPACRWHLLPRTNPRR